MITTTKALGIATFALLSVAGSTVRADGILPIQNEPEPTLQVDQPVAAPLASRGVAIIPYRVENFRILPIFGAAAATVSPRVGHLHVTLDDLPWQWADAGSTGNIILAGLPAGEHKLKIELATPEHKILIGQTISFTVPAMQGHHR